MVTQWRTGLLAALRIRATDVDVVTDAGCQARHTDANVHGSDEPAFAGAAAHQFVTTLPVPIDVDECAGATRELRVRTGEYVNRIEIPGASGVTTASGLGNDAREPQGTAPHQR